MFKFFLPRSLIEVGEKALNSGRDNTVQSLVDATGGVLYKEEVTAPLGNKVIATYGILGDGETAIIEMVEEGHCPFFRYKKWSEIL